MGRSDKPGPLISGRSTVQDPNLAQRLSECDQIVSSVTLMAITANSGDIFVGGPETSGVAGQETGYPLDDDGAYAELRIRTFTNINLRDIWIAAPVVNESVCWLAEV